MEVRTECEIGAPPERVWAVLLDFAAYPVWNPFISQIAGNLAVGQRLEATLSLADGSEVYLRPRVEVVVPERELIWSTQLWWPGVLDERQRFELVPTPAGTRFVNGRHTSGWALKLLTRRLTHSARGSVGMNEALRRRVEDTD